VNCVCLLLYDPLPSTDKRLLVNCLSRMTGKSKTVDTHGHKYYPIAPKPLNSITMATVTTHTFINIVS
jgi:hypothetical protein